jgi:hypothetical protein
MILVKIWLGLAIAEVLNKVILRQPSWRRVVVSMGDYAVALGLVAMLMD